MKTKLFSLLLSVITLAAFSIPAFAQQQKKTEKKHQMEMMQDNRMMMHQNKNMGTQKQDSTAMPPMNTKTVHHGHMMMNMQNQDSTAMPPGQSQMMLNQTICPVMGGKIDKQFFADYQGKRVCFCCQSCLKTFEKNPEKYLKLMEEQGIQLEKTPAPMPSKTKSEKSGTRRK